EGDHAERALRPRAQVPPDQLGHAPRLDRVGARPLAIVAALGYMLEADPAPLGRRRHWEGSQAAIVERLIREGVQRLVAAAIVPAQHPRRQPAGTTGLEHTLEAVGCFALFAF